MKIYTILFLTLAVITGIMSFTGLNYNGVEVMQILCFVFTDLFVISLFAKALFPENMKMRYQKVKK